MRRFPLVLLLLAVIAGAANTAPAVAQGTASSTSAEDYSGMYTFLRDGEFVQITQEEEGKVSGFVSRYGNLESDRGAFLDQFFKQGSLDGHHLSFATDTVHGVWFEFQGTAGRGAGKTADDEGYYVLKGTLTQHSADGNHKDIAKSREVVFKSFPQDVSGPSGKPKG